VRALINLPPLQHLTQPGSNSSPIMRSRSGSTTSNTSSKELPADNIPIQVIIGGGKSECFRPAARSPVDD